MFPTRTRISGIAPFVVAVGIIAIIAPAFINDILAPSAFAAHGYCILWQDDLLWLFTGSDAIIGLAYVVIAVSLTVLVWRVHRDLPFHWMFLSFSTFIFACGLTHFWAIVTLWQPWYWIDGALKVVTAIASITTALVVPLTIGRVERLIADARSAAKHRQERDMLLDEQLAAVTMLRTMLATKEGNLLGLTEEVAAQRRQRELLATQLRQSEARYRQIVETAREGICVTNQRNIITYVNVVMAEILRYTPDELIGQPATMILPQESFQVIGAHKEHRRSGAIKQHDTRLQTRDGQERWAMISANPLYDETGHFGGMLTMITDITERRRLEEQMFQTQKLESVGQLAGGIAHDFNNLLLVVRGSVDMIADTLAETDPAQEDVTVIRDATDRATTLTRQLLTFARHQPGTTLPVQLNALLERMKPLLTRLLPAQIELSFNLATDLSLIQADSGQIEQVVMNLAINARDAMPNGGQLTITSRNVRFDEVLSPPHPGLTLASYVRLQIRDTGIGMSEEVQRRAFEPFFTTKGLTSGTGLGLATCYGIVAQHGGVIMISSTLGKGTTFDTYLPVIEQRA